MKKIFNEYGGVITACIAIVAIIGVVGLMFTGTGSGWMENAFASVKDNFLNKADTAIDEIEAGGGLGGNSAEQPLVIAGAVPKKGAYMSAATGTTATEGMSLPVATGKGDIYQDEYYEYNYQYGWCFACEQWSNECGDFAETESWCARCINDVAQPGPLAESICGEPVTSLECAFYGCTALTTAPIIPSTVTDVDLAFSGCTALTVLPEVPDGVSSLQSTFSGCASLTNEDVCNFKIPNAVSSLSNTFTGCTGLTDLSGFEIPANITMLQGAFSVCTNLTTAPTIPGTVKRAEFVFLSCTALVTAPAIEEGVSSMAGVFKGCTALEVVPNIPSTVTNISNAFNGCASLETIPNIPQGVTQMYRTFGDCTNLVSVPAIPNNVTDMTYAFQNCSSLTGSIEINATLEANKCAQCFAGTTLPITIVGSASDETKAAFAATANGNVDWE